MNRTAFKEVYRIFEQHLSRGSVPKDTEWRSEYKFPEFTLTRHTTLTRGGDAWEVYLESEVFWLTYFQGRKIEKAIRNVHDIKRNRILNDFIDKYGPKFIDRI